MAIRTAMCKATLKQFTKATLPSVEEVRKGIEQLKDQLDKLQTAINVFSEQLSSLLSALPEVEAANGRRREGEPSWAAELQQMAGATVPAGGGVRQTLTRTLADSLDVLKVRTSFFCYVMHALGDVRGWGSVV